MALWQLAVALWHAAQWLYGQHFGGAQEPTCFIVLCKAGAPPAVRRLCDEGPAQERVTRGPGELNAHDSWLQDRDVWMDKPGTRLRMVHRRACDCAATDSGRALAVGWRHLVGIIWASDATNINRTGPEWVGGNMTEVIVELDDRWPWSLAS